MAQTTARQQDMQVRGGGQPVNAPMPPQGMPMPPPQGMPMPPPQGMLPPQGLPLPSQGMPPQGLPLPPPGAHGLPPQMSPQQSGIPSEEEARRMVLARMLAGQQGGGM